MVTIGRLAIRSSYFNLAPDAQLFGPGGELYRDFPTWDKYTGALLRRSTEILFRLDPVEEVRRRFPVFVAEADNDYLSSPAWPHTHTVDVRRDEVFLKFDSGLAQIETITISGFLQWRRRRRTPEFYIMEDAASGEPFAGAAVADYGSGDGRMFAMVLHPDSRTAGVHTFALLERHRNAIRRLKIPT